MISEFDNKLDRDNIQMKLGNFSLKKRMLFRASNIELAKESYLDPKSSQGGPTDKVGRTTRKPSMGGFVFFVWLILFTCPLFNSCNNIQATLLDRLCQYLL